jgi:hypothetical protein
MNDAEREATRDALLNQLTKALNSRNRLAAEGEPFRKAACEFPYDSHVRYQWNLCQEEFARNEEAISALLSDLRELDKPQG